MKIIPAKEADNKVHLQLYRQIVESVKDYAIIFLDPQGHIELWNIGAEHIIGYKAKEIAGKHFSTFYTKEAIDNNFPAYELKHAKKDGRFEDEGWRVRKDGTMFWASVIVTSVYNETGILLGFSKIIRDLTERKNAEEEIRRSEERNRLLVEGVRDYAIFFLDPKGNVSSWNEGAKKINGYTASEIIGKHFSIFYTEELKKKKYPEMELREAVKQGRFEDKGWRVRKDGSLYYVNVIITPVYNHKKELIGFSKITRDMTESRATEEMLRRSEERNRLLVEAVKDYAIFMLDPKGKVASWNSGAERLKGYTKEDIIGKHFSIFYPEEAKKRKYPDYELKMAAKDGRYEDEGLRVKKDGSTFYANVIITALRNKDNELIGFSKITRDLSERRLTEEKLNKLNRELETRVNERTEELSNTVSKLKRINADLDTFVYTASHDLKAPISNLEGLLTIVLAEGENQSPEIVQYLGFMKQSIEKLKVVISELTNISRVQKDMEEDVETVNFNELIEEFCITHQDIIKNNKVKFAKSLSEISIKFSKKNLRSILDNLLTNAIKYRSERKPEIQIKTSRQGEFVKLTVKDNGLGISAENQPKVFTMFKRFHTHVEGSGVGLYIVKRIIENAGGHIDVKSKQGEGSTFEVFFKA
ncbi:MAG: PAS domain S-box protein [Cytophagaceae bacterium]